MLGAGILYLLFWPVPIDPVVWTPDPDPGLTGPYAPNERLAPLELFEPSLGRGPEDVTRGPDGLFYTGLLDGRILRFDGSRTELVADTGGRPLGMQFDSAGRLIVADADRGLLAVNADGSIEVLVDTVDGARLLLTDDLDIAADGTIWFSDASRRFPVAEWILDFWEGRGTGRLLSHDPVSGETRAWLDGLRFANGVALGPDDAFVLVTETLAARIWRLWLTGPRAGDSEIFIDRLPGYPDNLSFNGRDTFWVALPATRQPALEGLAGRPFVRKILLRLPEALRRIEPAPLAWVIGLDPDGGLRYSLQTASGAYRTVTSVNEFDGQLYFGSIDMDTVARVPAP
jgi:sugar lactone lactonase YvrE